MHVLIILSTPLPPQEGIGFYTWNLAKELVKKGIKVSMITRGSIHKTTLESVDGITIYRPFYIPLYPFHVYLHGVFVNRLIRKLEKEIDIIHLHTPLVRFPSLNSPGVITFHTPIATDSKSIPVTDLLSFLIKLQVPISIRLEHELIKKGKIITSVSTSVAEELEAYEVDPKTVHVMGNGVDTQIFHPNPIISDVKFPKYFLSAGRLAPRKGLEDLIACAQIVNKRNSEVEFWIAGSGPYKKRLKVLAKLLGVENIVRFLGHIADRDEMAQLYQGAIGYVHPAHYEGLPTVLLEAMACGRPVVATAVSGALDVVEDGINGLLIPPHNPEGLAEKVFELLENSKLRTQLGQAATETIRERYSWPKVAQKYLDLYLDLDSEVSQ